MIAENTNGKATLDVEGYRRRVRQEENAQHKMICHQVKVWEEDKDKTNKQRQKENKTNCQNLPVLTSDRASQSGIVAKRGAEFS